MANIMRQQHTTENRHGVAATELAVCMPIILVLILGTMQACSMFYLKQNLTVSAYEGIRTSVEYRVQDDDVRATCLQILADRNVQGGAVTIEPSNFTQQPPGTWITVTVTAPTKRNSPVGCWFYQANDMTASATMMKEF